MSKGNELEFQRGAASKAESEDGNDGPGIFDGRQEFHVLEQAAGSGQRHRVDRQATIFDGRQEFHVLEQAAGSGQRHRVDR